jgi:hypothetical protein
MAVLIAQTLLLPFGYLSFGVLPAMIKAKIAVSNSCHHVCNASTNPDLVQAPASITLYHTPITHPNEVTISNIIAAATITARSQKQALKTSKLGFT